MARGFGLRARLIGGGGGQPQVGFLGGVAQGINNITNQMAQAQDPAYQQALQMQQLKMQAMRGQLEAQQQEREVMAGYRQLGEEAFPTGGITTPAIAPEPERAETELGQIEQQRPLSLNDRLQKALIQSGNLRAIQAIQAQTAPQPSFSGPPPTFELGGQIGFRDPSGNVKFVPNPKEPAEKTLNPNDLAAFVASNGALRGPSIPPDMTLPQAAATLKSIRDIQQQQINIKAPFYGALGGLAETRAAGLRGQLPVNPATIGNYINAQGQNPQADPQFANMADRTQENLNAAGYRTLDTQSRTGLRMSNIATTQLDRMDQMIDQLYKGVGPGANLGNAIKLKAQYATASGLIREFNTLRNETMPAMALSSGLTAGRVGEQIMEKIEKPMLPNDTDSYDTAKGKIRQLRQRLENNARVFYGTGIDRQIRVRDKGTNATGTLRLAPGELIPDNYEVQR